MGESAIAPFDDLPHAGGDTSMRMPRKLKVDTNLAEVLLGPLRLVLQKDPELAVRRG